MPRRTDKTTSAGSGSAGRASSRSSDGQRRASQRSRQVPVQTGQAQRPRARSHGSSRPESSSHQESYARQAGRQPTRQVSTRSRQRADARQASAYGAVRTARREDSPDEPELVSKSVGELRQADRLERAKKASRKRFIRIAVIAAALVALIIGGVALYHSPAFSIAHVEVNGVEHLTSDEMAQLANVPADTTLLRVDTDTIRNRIKQNAWVADAQVDRVFPDTLAINVTEREVFAVIEVPTSAGTSVKQWAIGQDHVWLMPIPDANSDAAKTTSSKIYEDAASALHVTDVPYGTKAEIGEVCSDSNVNNALDIVSGLTTDLAGRVAQVRAPGVAETTLVLDNGVEVAFGRAEDIRDKERVILQILQENEDNVAYINVRMVETPTWRSV